MFPRTPLNERLVYSLFAVLRRMGNISAIKRKEIQAKRYNQKRVNLRYTYTYIETQRLKQKTKIDKE